MRCSKLASMVFAVLLVSSTAFAADPIAISTNFVGGNGGQGTGGGSAAVTNMAGVVSVGNWNNGIPSTGSIVNAIDNSGATTGATVSWTSPNTWSATGAAPGGGGNADMMSGNLDNWGGDTISVTGLPSIFTSQGYDIYLYFHADSSGSHGATATDNLTNTDTAYAFQSGGGGTGYPLAGLDGFIVSTDTNSGTTTPSNVILLEGLTGSSFTLDGLDGSVGDGRSRPTGFQIVAHAAVPEPASIAIWTLIGLSLSGFGYWRMRGNK